MATLEKLLESRLPSRGEAAFAAVIPEELLMPARSRALSVHVTRKEAEILKLLTRSFSNAEIGVP
jgi:hypothetical protein